MKQSDSIAKLATALALAQSKIETAIRGSVNPHFKSHYADLASVWDACRTALNSNGLAVIQFPCDADVGRVGLTTIITHSSGEWMSETVSTRPFKDDSQGVGSALTYLRRYALSAVVGCTSTEDDDGNASSQPPSKYQAPTNPTPTNRPAPPIVFAKQPAHVPVAPPQVNAQPKPVTRPTTQAVNTDADIVVDCVLQFYKSDEGVSKSGKPYVKHRIGWTDGSGQKVYATTFSDSFGEIAQDAYNAGDTVQVSATKTKFGYDLTDLFLKESAVSSAGGEDEIPF